MRTLTTIFLLFTFCIICGQTVDSIVIKHKKEKYFLTKTCYDFLTWDEVVLKNKVAESKINTIVKSAVNSYRLTNDDSESRCKSEMEYDQECKAVYAKHNFASFFLTSYTYYNGAPHGERQFGTLNFDTKTGKQLNFHDFIDPNKVSDLDTLIVGKLKEELQITDDFQLEENWKKQLPNLEFNLSDKGIEISFRGERYVESIINVELSFKELKPYLKQDGLLKEFYANTN